MSVFCPKRGLPDFSWQDWPDIPAGWLYAPVMNCQASLLYKLFLIPHDPSTFDKRVDVQGILGRFPFVGRFWLDAWDPWLSFVILMFQDPSAVPRLYIDPASLKPWWARHSGEKLWAWEDDFWLEV